MAVFCCFKRFISNCKFFYIPLKNVCMERHVRLCLYRNNSNILWLLKPCLELTNGCFALQLATLGNIQNAFRGEFSNKSKKAVNRTIQRLLKKAIGIHKSTYFMSGDIIKKLIVYKSFRRTHISGNLTGYTIPAFWILRHLKFCVFAHNLNKNF